MLQDIRDLRPKESACDLSFPHLHERVVVLVPCSVIECSDGKKNGWKGVTMIGTTKGKNQKQAVSMQMRDKIQIILSSDIGQVISDRAWR
jgi:hypothetical protein